MAISRAVFRWSSSKRGFVLTSSAQRRRRSSGKTKIYGLHSFIVHLMELPFVTRCEKKAPLPALSASEDEQREGRLNYADTTARE